MSDARGLHIDDADHFVTRLGPEHSEALQMLFEQCADYVLLVDGESVSPHAAKEIFATAPPGRSLSGKFLYGLWNRQGAMVGVLEGMRDYPDEATWWIGLLLLAPEVRGRGLGRKLIEGFADYVSSEHGMAIMLGVVEENHPAYRFWERQGFKLVRQTEPRQFGKKTQRVYVMRWAVASPQT